MDEVVEQRWHILDVDGEPGGAVRRISGRKDPPAGTTTAAVLEQLRAEG